MTAKLIIKYLKAHIIVILTFFTSAAILAATFYLYGYPLADFLYSALLCSVIWLVISTMRFISFRRKYLSLLDMGGCVTFDISDPPKTDNAVEEEYLNLIAKLFTEKTCIEGSSAASRSELLDYYTMWVHQIKVPLAALKLLIESDENDKNKQMNELFKINQYVEMVMGYLRMESMSADLLLKNYSLDSLVKQAVRKYSALFINKKIRLEISEICCDVLTDEKWLSFMLEQILSNAIKYTKEGGIITIYSVEPKTLVIEDNGIGIAPEDIKRVFQRGFTGYNGREHKKSTGIGLYLCRRIADKLTHNIRIESEIGKGTKILLELDNADIAIE